MNRKIDDAREKGGAFHQVLRIVGFQRLWFGQIASQLAANALLFVLALRVYQISHSNAAVSGLFLVYGLPAVLFGMIAGTIVDKLHGKSVLITCDIVRVVLVVGLFFFSKDVVAVYIFTFLFSLVTQFYVPAEAPMIPRLVPESELVTANSLFSFTYFSSLAVGSICAGTFLRTFGPSGVFLFIAVLFGVAAVFASQIPNVSDKKRTLEFFAKYSFSYLWQRVLLNSQEGIAYMRGSRVLTDALILLAGTQVTLAILGTLGPGFADSVLQIDVRDTSVLIVGPAVLGIIIGAIWVGAVGQKFRQETLIRRGITAAGILLMLIALTVRLKDVPGMAWLFSPSVILPVEFFLFFFLGVANSLLDVPANAVLQQEAKGEIRGRIYGMLTTVVGGIGMLPVVVGGVLADTIGVGRVIFFLGLSIGLYGLFRSQYNKS